MKALEIELRAGDLTKLEADAITNPANSLMFMGGGVAGALKRAGGEEIEKEARSKAPVPVGSAVATTAGRLKAKYVIHAPTMERPAMPTTGEKVYRATRAAIMCADEVGAGSLAIPGMGTGVGGLSFEEAARAMVSAIKDCMPELKNLKKIILCDINEQMVDAWRGELKRQKLL